MNNTIILKFFDNRRMKKCAFITEWGAKVKSKIREKTCEVLSVFFVILFALSGCSNNEIRLSVVDGLDELGSVQVVAREEGSGTRTSFAEIIGLSEDVEEGEYDRTTENAVTAESTDEVIAKVEESKAAIGYISMGYINESDNVKILAINDAQATLINVKNGDYPLYRPFSLSWSGDLNDLEQDFLTYVEGKGQAIVEQSYVAIKDETTFLSGQYSGKITIHGSSSVAPLIEELAAEYMEINTSATIEITVSDSTEGINDAIQGKCDFGMSSRELKDYEEELLDYRVIARDGIAVIVNSDNPLSDVTLDELEKLFDGTFSEWNDINTERGNE